jgi:hypothetical protein
LGEIDWGNVAALQVRQCGRQFRVQPGYELTAGYG